jgi:hypothetical protein
MMGRQREEKKKSVGSLRRLRPRKGEALSCFYFSDALFFLDSHIYFCSPLHYITENMPG